MRPQLWSRRDRLVGACGERRLGGSRAFGEARALVALGVLVGMLAIWAPGAQAALEGPDGPERVYALTIKDKLLRFDGDDPSQVNSKA